MKMEANFCLMILAVMMLLKDARGGDVGLEHFSALLFDSGKVKITICNSLECEYALFMEKSQLNDPPGNDELLVFFPTINIEFDPYINQYVGVVFNLFELCDNIHFVISSFSHFLSKPINSEMDFIALKEWSLSGCDDSHRSVISITQRYSTHYCNEFKMTLQHFGKYPIFSPKKIALVAINDPVIALVPDALILRHNKQLQKPLFLHLNQEMPWRQAPVTLQTEIFAYQQAFKVFRTVYYDALEPYASYIPVRSGALLTSKYVTPQVRATKNYHTPETLVEVLPASIRPVLCSFAGGLKYSTLGGEERQDRVEMVEAFQNFEPCELFASDDTKADSHKLTKFEYIELMRGTVFVLCPTGLNPETQRPHQAMELGAIPLSLRVSEPHLDYLSQWRGYPGPLFDSWREVREFLQAVAEGVISLDEVDVLQQEVRAWQQSYELSTQELVREAVVAYMAAVPSHEDL